MAIHSSVFPVVALALGGVGGFILGQGSGSNTEIVEVRSTKSVEMRTTEAAAGKAGNLAEDRPRSTDEIFRAPGQNERVAKLMAFYQDLDPALYAEEARKLEDLPWSERIIASYLLFSQWGEESPVDALAFADTMGFGGRFVKPTVLQSWAGEDPAGAAQYYSDNTREFGGMGGRGRGGSAAEGVAKEWARRDPAAALAWAQSLDGGDGEASVRGVFQQISQDDPAAAARMLAENPGVAGRAEVIESIGQNYGKTDPAAGEAWANSLTGDDRERALSDVISGLALTDPSLAGDKALEMAPGQFRDEALGRTAGEYSREAPAEALEFLVANASEEGQSEYIGTVMANYARQDDAGARAFIAGQADGPVRDSAAAYYVFANRNESFDTVVAIASTIQDENRRSRSISRAARQGMQSSPEATRTFIESTDQLSDRQKERLLN